MAEEPKSVCEWLDIELDKLSADDKINLIGEISDELTAQQLRQVREMINQKRLSKIEEAKVQVIEEMREKFVQLDLDFDEIFDCVEDGGGNPWYHRNTEALMGRNGVEGEIHPFG